MIINEALALYSIHRQYAKASSSCAQYQYANESNGAMITAIAWKKADKRKNQAVIKSMRTGIPLEINVVSIPVVRMLVKLVNGRLTSMDMLVAVQFGLISVPNRIELQLVRAT